MDSSDSSISSKVSSRLTTEDLCETCGSKLKLRRASGFPIFTQILFALSFGVFLMLIDRIRLSRTILLAWTIAQVLLGVLLVRARIRSSKKILVCIHCEQR